MILIYLAVSVWACELVSRHFGVKDAGEMVADEIVGMWLALFALPALWWVVLLGFVLFRILDIRKPWIIGWLDREVPGGLGVMIDDVVSGIVTAGVIWALVLIFRALGTTAG